MTLVFSPRLHSSVCFRLFFTSLICCFLFGWGTREPNLAATKTPPPNPPGAGLRVVAILRWHGIDSVIFSVLPGVPLLFVTFYYVCHPLGHFAPVRSDRSGLPDGPPVLFELEWDLPQVKAGQDFEGAPCWILQNKSLEAH